MFSHLHCHTIGSFSDSTLHIEEAVKKVAADGQAGLAVTDHGTLTQPFHFIKTCKKHNIKPMIGCEINFVENAHKTIVSRDNERYHLVLIAKDAGGLSNLIAIINKSWEENNYWGKRGLVDWELLRKHREGIVCLTGCFWNIVARAEKTKGFSDAEENFIKLHELFGEDLYCELGNHNVEAEVASNELLIKLADKYSVKCVVTNDVHYLNRKDRAVHDCYIKSRFEKLSNFSYDGTGFELKTIKEIKELGFNIKYLENTLEVTSKCNIDLKSFKKGRKVGEETDIQKALQNGQAAYLPEVEKVPEERAKQICEKLNMPPEIYKKLTGLWRRPGLNPNKIAVSIEPRLNQITPLFMHQGKMVCQLSEKELKNQDIEVIDV
ncbi:MAG: PHP domain-containing protein [Elusimicrobia bacterium]|jgi:DNA polymerase-3 subunit alpha|nr:PHP domain-containing protein [Elusimicrobiota bacterium]